MTSNNGTTTTTLGSLGLTAEEWNHFLPILIVVLAIVLGTAFLCYKSIWLVRHAEVMIVERFGRYKTTLKPGLHWLWPAIDTPRMVNWRYLDVQNNNANAQVVCVRTQKVDLREHVIDFGLHHVITQDTVEMFIDALVYFRITDPRTAVLEIENLPDAIELLTQSSLRNIIATMTLDDTFSSREKINHELLFKMRKDAERWGVVVTRVEIFDIQPGAAIKSAMEKQIKAERTRRAEVTSAEGKRQSEIIRSRGRAARIVFDAVGEAKKAVNEAAGQAEAKTMVAQAEATEISQIKSQMRNSSIRAVDYISAMQWLNAMKRLVDNQQANDVVLLPVTTLEGINKLVGSAAPSLMVR